MLSTASAIQKLTAGSSRASRLVRCSALALAWCVPSPAVSQLVGPVSNPIPTPIVKSGLRVGI